MKRIIRKIFRKLSRHDRVVFAGIDPQDRKIIADIRKHKLTYLSGSKLASIVHICHAIERDGLPGIFIEAGCALGGSAILISKLKRQDRPFNVYDVFDMIPPPTSEDGEDVQNRYKKISNGKSSGIGGDRYYGYEDNLYQKVQDNLQKFDIDQEQQNVFLIKGLLQDTLEVDQPVAFAHIDVDWYDPVLTCLERIIPHLVLGGSVVLDDYLDWSGCRTATDKYFQGRKASFQMDTSAGSIRITRIKN